MKEKLSFLLHCSLTGLIWLQSAGYTGKVKIGMDVAASEFYNKEDNKYDLDFKNQGTEKHDKTQIKTG